MLTKPPRGMTPYRIVYSSRLLESGGLNNASITRHDQRLNACS